MKIFPFLLLRRGLYESLAEERSPSSSNLIVNKIIKDRNKKLTFRIISNVILKDVNKYTHLLEHIVINDNGIFLLSTFNIKGDIEASISSSYWKIINEDKEEYIVNPFINNDINKNLLENYFNNKYVIHPLIINMRNNINEDIKDLIKLNDIGNYLSTYPSENKLNKEEIQIIYKNLIHYIKNQPSIDEHISNMDKYHKLIQKDKCPYCVNKLIKKDGQLFCPSCKRFIY